MAKSDKPPLPERYDKPPAPDHLSAAMRAFWEATFEQRRLQMFQIHLLEKACESYDRAEAARKILDTDGLTFLDRFNQPRARPECNVEAVARAQFMKLITAVGLYDMYFVRGREPDAKWEKS
jgi:phage terminase small subunit